MITITYRKYSFFEYRQDEMVLFVDPSFSEYQRGEWVPTSDVRRCDYVAVTHGDFDHYLDVDDLLVGTDAVMIGSYALCRDAADGAGLPFERFLPLRDGESARTDGFRIEACAADHRSLRTLWRDFLRRPTDLAGVVRLTRNGVPSAPLQTFAMQFGELRVHHIGEAFNDLTDWREVAEVAKALPADILVVSADLDFDREVARGVGLFAPKVVLLHHPHERIYRRLGLKSLPLARFADRIRSACPACEVILLEPGDQWRGGQSPGKAG